MKIDRRRALAAASLAALVGAVRPAAAQTASQAPATPSAPTTESVLKALVERAMQNRHRLTFDGRTFNGPAFDLLVREGAAARFFLIGEDHGIAENPKLAAALFEALAPHGYDKVGVEISPPMARLMDEALAAGGLEGLKTMFRDPGSQVAFFGMAEESAWLARARQIAPRGRPFLWGLDYEIGGDRRLIAELRTRKKPAAAQAALEALDQASTASWAKYAQTRNPLNIFAFAGDPALVRAVRAAWPSPDARSDDMLETLERTLAINAAWTAGKGYDSNRLRSETMKANFLRHWRTEKAAGRTPKVLFKMGGYHMMRGRSGANVYDVGNLLPEVATIEGGTTFSMLVVAGIGSQTAGFDPSAWTYRPNAGGALESLGFAPLAEAVWRDAYTLIDLRPLRPLLSPSRLKLVTPELASMIHGFDTLLVMSGSTASANL